MNRNFAGDVIGSPFDGALLERTDGALRDEGEDRQQEHAREDPVDVEGVPGVVDELAESRRGPEQFADDGTDDGQPKTDVEAGENPRERGRDDDLEGQAPVVGAEDPGD